MDDTDSGSGAAQRALADPGSTDRPGLWGRMFGGISSSNGSGDTDANGHARPEPRQHGLINLSRMLVEDVAIPKADIIAVPDTVTKEELVEVFRETGMTRIPVYEGTLDTPIGFVHLKDVALLHGFNGGSTPFDLSSMLRRLLFVPSSMPIGVLLTKMQTERRHMALVIDEYGGVDGLLTIEDLVEQVVGEIEDEHDTGDAQSWVMDKPGHYTALAKTPLEEFEQEIGLSLTESDDIDPEEIDTLGGLVFVLCGRVPVRGEVVQHPAGLEFEVLDADPRRIKRLRVRMPGTSK